MGGGGGVQAQDKVIPPGFPMPPPDLLEDKMHLYKVSMCRNVQTKGVCFYGAKCHFAHSQHEQRREGYGPTPEELLRAHVTMSPALQAWWRQARAEFRRLQPAPTGASAGADAVWQHSGGNGSGGNGGGGRGSQWSNGGGVWHSGSPDALTEEGASRCLALADEADEELRKLREQFPEEFAQQMALEHDDGDDDGDGAWEAVGPAHGSNRRRAPATAAPATPLPPPPVRLPAPHGRGSVTGAVVGVVRAGAAPGLAAAAAGAPGPAAAAVAGQAKPAGAAAAAAAAVVAGPVGASSISHVHAGQEGLRSSAGGEPRGCSPTPKPDALALALAVQNAQALQEAVQPLQNLSADAGAFLQELADHRTWQVQHAPTQRLPRPPAMWWRRYMQLRRRTRRMAEAIVALERGGGGGGSGEWAGLCWALARELEQRFVEQLAPTLQQMRSVWRDLMLSPPFPPEP